jgi:hypothetical protein
MTTPGVGMVQFTNLDSKGVDDGLLQKSWESLAYVESLLPLSPLGQMYKSDMIQTVALGPDEEQAPSQVFLDITVDNKGVRSVTKPFLRAHAGDAIEGNASTYIGSEINLRLKYATFYANDYACPPIASQEYGIDAREFDVYGANEKIIPLQWQWLAEYRDFSMHHACVENICNNMTAAPLSQTARLNEHIWLPNLSDVQQPQFVTSATEYLEAVGDAVTFAGVNYTTNVLDVPAILDATTHYQNLYFNPIDKKYYLLVSDKQALRLSKGSVADTFGKYLITAGTDYDILKAKLPDVVGLVGDVVVLKDKRSPTLLLSGSNSSWALTAGYVRQGRTDGRTTTTGALALDVNIFLGAGAIAKMETEMPHLEKQFDEYGKYRGDILVGAVSYQTCRWDIDTPSDSDKRQQESVGLILTNRI